MPRILTMNESPGLRSFFKKHPELNRRVQRIEINTPISSKFKNFNLQSTVANSININVSKTNNYYLSNKAEIDVCILNMQRQFEELRVVQSKMIKLDLVLLEEEEVFFREGCELMY